MFRPMPDFIGADCTRCGKHFTAGEFFAALAHACLQDCQEPVGQIVDEVA